MTMKDYKPRGRYRLAAEWEAESAVLIALPACHTDWAYMLEEAQKQCVRLVEAMLGAGQRVILICPADNQLSLPENPLLTLCHIPYNDTWTRDYGPLAVGDETGSIRLLDFGFNAWGLKFAADKDNLVNMHLGERDVLPMELLRNCRNFILEGGSVETDGKGTLLTTTRCLCSPNRNGGMTKQQLNETLRKYLGIEHVLWLDYGALEGDDTDSHIDTLARMAPDDTILYTGTSGTDDAQARELERMKHQLQAFRTMHGEPFNLVELPLPQPIFDSEGNRLPATYANYLVTPTHLFMPAYEQPLSDTLAAQILQSVFPNHKIITVDCRAYLNQHGSLHCATMQIPLKAFEKP